MCKQGYMMRVSNRGAAIRELVSNTTYEVNIPCQLRSKQVNVEVISGLIVLDTDKANFPTLKEVGVMSDIGAKGFDCETQYGTNQFQAQGFSTLFDVALQDFNTTASKSKVSFHTGEKYTFQVGSLPEKFTFSTYSIEEDEPALGSMVAGDVYKILTVGTTDFTTLGASSSTVGEVFTYNGVSTSGSGTVLSLQTKSAFSNPYYCSFVLKITEQDD
jgi:hypothetical protein